MIEFDEDFEDFREGDTVLSHMTAGALAGVAEHCVMFPIDTIKTNMQAVRESRSPVLVARTIARRYGLTGFFRGIGPLAAGAAPAHALHFSVYEFCKRKLGDDFGVPQPLNTGMAGGCATVVSDAIMAPSEAVKQRMQLRVNNYRSALHCATSVAKREGARALWASYTTTLLMNVPYQGIYFASYEGLRSYLKRTSENEFDAKAHCLAGGGSGVVAAALTTPMDVAKTRLQTQGEVLEKAKYRGMTATMRLIHAEEGWRGLSRGIAPRMLQHSTSAAAMWVTYEFVKLKVRGLGY